MVAISRSGRAQPSYPQNFARSANESDRQQAREGIIALWVPELGPSGPTLRDWSGRGRDATLTNMEVATDWGVDEHGYALSYGGTDEHALGPDIPTELAYTFRIWFKLDEAWDAISNKYNHVLSQGNVFFATPYEFAIGYRTHTTASNQELFMFIRDSGGTLRFIDFADASTIWPSGEWHELVISWINGDQRLYVDGIERSSTAVTQDPGSSSNSVRIGGPDAETSSSRFAVATIGLVSIYNRILTPREIRKGYEDPLGIIRRRQSPLGFVAAVTTVDEIMAATGNFVIRPPRYQPSMLPF